MGNINEHDMTKMMLDALNAKSSKHQSLIRENEEMMGVGSEATVETADTETDFFKSLSDIEKEYFKEDVKPIREQVDMGTEFTVYKINKDKKEVIIGGELSNGFVFQYSKNGGMQLGTPENSRYVQFDKEVLNTLQGLANVYDNWVEEWKKRFVEDSMLKSDGE